MAKTDTAQARYRLRNPEKYREATKRYRAKLGREKLREIEKANYNKLKEAVFGLLGSACAHCGFTDRRALQVDHVYGGGTKERARIGNVGYYRRALKHPDDYQILCANCNWIKRAENGEVRNGK